jgi:predicted TIM-barrel fold metal-dependent hydrolase
MILGSVFDLFLKLQIVIGHMGEGLPFFMQPVDVMSVEPTQLKRPVSAYLRDNLHYTFAGFNLLFWISCSKSARAESCSRPIIPTLLWLRRAHF